MDAPDLRLRPDGARLTSSRGVVACLPTGLWKSVILYPVDLTVPSCFRTSLANIRPWASRAHWPTSSVIRFPAQAVVALIVATSVTAQGPERVNPSGTRSSTVSGWYISKYSPQEYSPPAQAKV